MACSADTSVIVAYYGNDALSPQAQALLRSLGQPAFFTALHRLEVKTAPRLAVFRRRRTSSPFARRVSGRPQTRALLSRP